MKVTIFINEQEIKLEKVNRVLEHADGTYTIGYKNASHNSVSCRTDKGGLKSVYGLADSEKE